MPNSLHGETNLVDSILHCVIEAFGCTSAVDAIGNDLVVLLVMRQRIGQSDRPIFVDNALPVPFDRKPLFDARCQRTGRTLGPHFYFGIITGFEIVIAERLFREFTISL